MCVAVGDGGPEETPKKASTTQRQETVDPQCEGADTEEIVRLPVDKDRHSFPHDINLWNQHVIVKKS